MQHLSCKKGAVSLVLSATPSSEHDQCIEKTLHLHSVEKFSKATQKNQIEEKISGNDLTQQTKNGRRAVFNA